MIDHVKHEIATQIKHAWLVLIAPRLSIKCSSWQSYVGETQSAIPLELL